MQIVIDIPNPPSNQKIIDIPIHFCGGQVVDAGGYGFEERKTGKWIDGHCMCSICKWYQTNRFGFAVSVDYNYCPNCGVEMEDSIWRQTNERSE